MVSVTQYKQITSTFSKKRKAILIKLYLNAPFTDTNHSATTLGYPNFLIQLIYKLGYIISKESGVVPNETYIRRGKEVPSHYTLIHNYFKDHWKLVNNLETAIKNLGW